MNCSRRTKRTLCLWSIAYGVLSAGGLMQFAQAGAPSEPPGEVRTRAVSIEGLNLARQGDVRKLYHRIGLAAGQVCGRFDVDHSALKLEAKARVMRCEAESIARAVAEINASALTQYHLVQTHQAPNSTVVQNQSGESR